MKKLSDLLVHYLFIVAAATGWICLGCCDSSFFASAIIVLGAMHLGAVAYKQHPNLLKIP